MSYGLTFIQPPATPRFRNPIGEVDNADMNSVDAGRSSTERPELPGKSGSVNTVSEYKNESKIDMRHLNGRGGCPFKYMNNVLCVGQSGSGQYRCECLGSAPAVQSRGERNE